MGRLMLYSLLLVSISGDLVSASGRTAEDCEIGDEWTDNYIRFECYEGEGIVVKGVRAIGCVPSNTDAGAMILPGATFDELYFTYNCTEQEDTVYYQIRNCRDSAGKPLLVDETRRAKDGADWKCYRDAKGAVKLSVGGSCIHKGKLRAVGEKWTDTDPLKDTVAGKEQTIGKGTLMRCTGDSKKGFYMEAYGCVTSAGASLANGQFGGVGKNFVQCKIATTKGKPATSVLLKVVDEKVVTCPFNGTIVKSNVQYTTKAGDVYFCKFALIKKIGCMLQGKQYKIGLTLVAGKWHACSGAVPGMFAIDITGCTLPDKSTKPFFAKWTTGEQTYECKYTLKGTTVTPYIAGGCFYLGKPVAKYVIVGKGAALKKCALKVDRTGYEMRDMTAAEVAEYYKAKSSPESVYGGVGGSGSGDELTAQPGAITVPGPSKDGGREVEVCTAACSATCKL